MSASNSPFVFDRSRLAQRRRRARDSYQSVDFLKRRVAEDVADRILLTKRHFPVALETGAGFLNMRDDLAPFVDTHICMDLSPEIASFTAQPTLASDEELLPFKEHSLDLIISALSLHWVNDLPGALIQARNALKPDGFFVAAMLGGNTLTELRQVLLQAESELTGGAEMRVSPFADALDLSQLLQRAGFALPVSDRDQLTLRYDSMFALLNDLKASGETHSPFTQGRRPLSRRILMRAAQLYAEQFSDPDGRIRASIDIMWVTGWAPHPDQPKPARRGSGTVSLAEAVGSVEQKTGDKAG